MLSEEIASSAKLGTVLRGVTYAVATLALLALMLHTVVNALVRTIARVPIRDTTEVVAAWYMPIAVLLGILIAFQLKKHTRASLLFAGLSDRSQMIVESFSVITQAALVGAIAYFSALEAVNSVSIRERYRISDVIVWPVKVLMALVFFGSAIVLIGQLVAIVRSGAVETSPTENVA